MKFSLTEEQRAEIRAEFAGKEQRIGGISFQWNPVTKELEVIDEDEGTPISQFDSFL